MRSPNGENTGLRIVICVKADEPGFHAFCHGLAGVHTYGITKEEAVDSARDAIIANLKSLVKHGDPIPAALFHVPESLTHQTEESHCTNEQSVIQCLELVKA